MSLYTNNDLFVSIFFSIFQGNEDLRLSHINKRASTVSLAYNVIREPWLWLA